MVERVPTGISGLDEIIDGGLVKNRQILLSGGPGTGKTLMSYEYLYRGADKFNEKGLFLTLEQNPSRVVESAKLVFNWDWDKHLNKNIIVSRLQRSDFDNMVSIIEDYVNNQGIKRVVIDSLTLLKLYFRNDDAYRNHLYELVDFLADLSCTTLMANEKTITKREESRYGMEEFVADGVIHLYLLPRRNDRFRALEVEKMRDTNHSLSIYPFMIASDGIMVSSKAGVISEVE